MTCIIDDVASGSVEVFVWRAAKAGLGVREHVTRCQVSVSAAAAGGVKTALRNGSATVQRGSERMAVPGTSS